MVVRRIVSKARRSFLLRTTRMCSLLGHALFGRRVGQVEHSATEAG